MAASGQTPDLVRQNSAEIHTSSMSTARLVCAAVTFLIVLTIYSPAQTLTTLLNFNITDGANPQSPLVQGVDGNLYGTTVFGGQGDGPCSSGNEGCGTIFKISSDGTLTTLYSFCTDGTCQDGASPLGSLVLAVDGNFYGTTSAGGSYGDGTVFKITPAGVLTTLYNFGTDGGFPQAGLVQASDGNFYGTTKWGGAHGSGIVFRITPAGTFTDLYAFCSQAGCVDGGLPSGALMQANDGNLYGTTESSGAGNAGTIFRITLGGTFTTMHAFGGDEGGLPVSGLIQGTDGNLYGTTPWGGDGSGAVFKMTLSGSVTALHGFAGYPTDGASPEAPLIQATDGNFYGTTSMGGAHDDGTVFQITLAGALTTLYSFCSQQNCMDGSTPNAAVVQDTNGLFYGTTRDPTNCYPTCGTVFSLNMGFQPFVETQPTSGSANTPVIIFGSNLSGTTAVTFNGTPATFNVVSDSQITATVPSGATTGTVQVTTPSGTLTSNTDFQIVGPIQFVSVAPCRLVDTRTSGGPITGGTSRNFSVPQLGGCGIPVTAAAYSLNVTVVPRGSLSYLRVWPAGEIEPFVSTMNSLDGRIKANAAIVPAGNNAVSVYVSDTTDVVLDIDGYFSAPGASTLKFYPLPPCRVADTRKSDFPPGLGVPNLSRAVARDFPVLESSCIPSGVTPAAYSLNVTAIPYPAGAPLAFLELWPTGQQPQHPVSTLNNPTGTYVANAAIVPAGTDGKITALPSDNTDLAIDINGYFATSGSNGLSLYPIVPCRVIDTRAIGSGQPFSGTLSPPVDVVGSTCGIPSTAAGYVFNTTVVPSPTLSYLTLWPDGQNQPVVSTLNAADGWITSNMAIVPTSDGSIDAYAAGVTQLILDISSYFAP